jgi:UDP-glucose 4-epimerase
MPLAEKEIRVEAGKTIGVTGSAGYIGSHVVDRLIERGDRVIGLDNLAYGRRENFEHHLNNSRFAFHEVDVTDAPTTIDLLRDCEVIVHLAAHKIPRYASAMQTLKVNSEGSISVLEAARVRMDAGDPARVVLASTSDVYGKSRDRPFKEDGNILLGPSDVPRWSYATSKLFEEHLAFAYTEEYGIPAAIMRFFGSYGPRHHLSWWGGPQSVFISALLDGETITIHGDGQQTRTFTFITDTVNGVLGCIDTPTEGCEVFNIGAAHGEIPIVDFARLIHRLVREECPDLDIPVEAPLEFVSYESFSKHRYEDVIRRVPDVTKARTVLGVEATVTVEDGLRETIRWHRLALEKSRAQVGQDRS